MATFVADTAIPGETPAIAVPSATINRSADECLQAAQIGPRPRVARKSFTYLNSDRGPPGLRECAATGRTYTGAPRSSAHRSRSRSIP